MAESFEQLRLEFLAETEDTLDELQRDLNRLGEGIGRQAPADVVDRVFRTTHSLKGVAGMFGLDQMSSVSHVLESVFTELREGRLTLDDPLLDLLYQGNESLHRLLAHASGKHGGNPQPEAERVASRIEDHLRDRLRPLDPDDGADTNRSTLIQLAESERAEVARVAREGRKVVLVEASFDEHGFEEPFRHLLETVRQWGTVHGTVPGERDPVRGSFRIRLVASGEAELFQLMKTLGPIGAEVTPCDPQEILDGELAGENPSLEEDESSLASTATSSAPLPGGTLRVPVERVDRLLHQLADLIRAKMSLDSRTEELAGPALGRHARTMLRQSLRNLDRRIRTLQAEILQVRMVTLASQFQMLERTLRETCRSTGKEARLVTSGDGVELDKRIVEDLVDPLVHLVRNAVDHGLEARGERVRTGKDPTGTVRIDARTEGSHTVLEISDDGAGLDLHRILEKARRDGILPEGDAPSRGELLDVIFRPGFTVREEATRISGRGVGLDAVRARINELGGLLDVETGRSGTRFRLRIPTTLAITHALMVRAAGESFCLPLASVVEVVHVGTDRIDTVGGDEVIVLDERATPIRDLGKLLGLGSVARDRRSCPAVVLGLAERRLALLVDQLCGQREIVISTLGPLLPAVPGVSGSTELGDGRTLLILDAVGLLELAGRAEAEVDP